MSRGQVVILEDDDWVARLLETGLREHGYDIAIATEALEGVQRVSQLKPACIICDITLPDFDGYWVAQQVRSGAPDIAATPLLFLSQIDDDAAALKGLQVGADALISKPFRVNEVIAQVDALVDMAQRLRAARTSISHRPKAPIEALQGKLEEMSLVTVLTILEMERRSGELRFAHGSSVATLELRGGYASGGSLGAEKKDLVAILRQVLAWKTGVFSFRVGPDVAAPERRRTIAGMLVEAVLPEALPGGAAEARGH